MKVLGADLDSDAQWIVAQKGDETVLVTPSYESWESNRTIGSPLSSDVLSATRASIRISRDKKEGTILYVQHSRKRMHSGTCEPIKPEG
jgi:hypothetical protein